MSESLAEALPREIARVQELMPAYVEIGSAGLFALAMMKNSIAVAHKAMMEGDVVAMIRALKDLKEYES